MLNDHHHSSDYYCSLHHKQKYWKRYSQVSEHREASVFVIRSVTNICPCRSRSRHTDTV